MPLLLRPILAACTVISATTSLSIARDLGISEDALRTACTGDYLRLCAGIDPNGDHVEACFRAKMARVSEGCRGAIAGYRVQETTNERRSQSR